MGEFLMQHFEWGFDIGIVAALAASAYFALKQIARMNKDALYDKKADILVHCNERYERILRRAFEQPPNDSLVQRLYWGLLSDQFTYFVLDYVDAETAADWFSHLRAWALDEATGLGFDPKTSWAELGRKQHAYNEYFVPIVDACVSPDAYSRQELEAALMAAYRAPVNVSRRRSLEGSQRAR